MPEDIDPRPLTDDELKALAHPLRVRMLEALAIDGPATASQLAERFGESSGATSYHLRQLARHGFIEDDQGRGKGRERWWRILRRGWTLPAFDFRQRAETRADANVLLHELERSRVERLLAWWQHFDDWGEGWVKAALDADSRLKLTQDELRAFTEELKRLHKRYADLDQARPEPPEGAALVDIQLYAFPVRLVDEDALSEP